MIARTVGLVVAYGALTGLLTWPLPLQIGSHVLASGPFFLGDILLIVWATTWGAHALATDPSRLFEGNTFYPSGGAVLGSDHFLGTLPVFAPVWAATGNPIAALNVHLWASACEPDSEPPHAARQARAVLCLDDQVDVIVLDRVMDDPEPAVGGRGQPTPDGREDPGGAEAANGIRGPERDVDGMGGPVPRSGPVRHAGTAPGCRLPTGARSSTAPGAGGG